MKTLLDPVAKDELLTRLKQLTPESKRQWGKMTAPQMVCHLNDGFEMLLGKLKTADQSSVFTRTVVKFGALRVPAPWPHGATAPKEIDQTIAGTKPAELDQDVARLIGKIEHVCAMRDFAFARHPLFGNLSEWEGMRLGYLHVDHHLRQFGL